MPSKYQLTGDLVAALGPASSVLDVGCRDCTLRGHLPPATRYTGVDLEQNATGTVDHIADLTRGLAFPDRAFDAVCALDVIEHTDDIHASFAELARVASRLLIVVLPNMAHAGHRARLLGTGHLGAKYRLPTEPIADRHRWVTTHRDILPFYAAAAQRHGLRLTLRDDIDLGPRKALLRWTVGLLLPRAWWSWNVMGVFRRG
jgi:SAM-dependent methyltransferase